MALSIEERYGQCQSNISKLPTCSNQPPDLEINWNMRDDAGLKTVCVNDRSSLRFGGGEPLASEQHNEQWKRKIMIIMEWRTELLWIWMNHRVDTWRLSTLKLKIFWRYSCCMLFHAFHPFSVFFLVAFSYFRRTFSCGVSREAFSRSCWSVCQSMLWNSRCSWQTWTEGKLMGLMQSKQLRVDFF